MPMVVKKDGVRETFDRMKILAGLKKACEKRSVSIEAIEEVVDKLEAYFVGSGEKEIAITDIGEAVMGELKELDDVAYVRFASVYREFRDINEFMKEMKELIGTKGKKTPKKES